MEENVKDVVLNDAKDVVFNDAKDVVFNDVKDVLKDVVDRVAMSVDVVSDSGMLFFTCPHCFEYVIVKRNEVNCKIFRHGAMKNGGIGELSPISPHLPKEQCDELFRKGLIYGCGKPFYMDGKNVSICGYI